MFTNPSGGARLWDDRDWTVRNVSLDGVSLYKITQKKQISKASFDSGRIIITNNGKTKESVLSESLDWNANGVACVFEKWKSPNGKLQLESERITKGTWINSCLRTSSVKIDRFYKSVPENFRRDRPLNHQYQDNLGKNTVKHDSDYVREATATCLIFVERGEFSTP